MWTRAQRREAGRQRGDEALPDALTAAPRRDVHRRLDGVAIAVCVGASRLARKGGHKGDDDTQRDEGYARGYGEEGGVSAEDI